MVYRGIVRPCHKALGSEFAGFGGCMARGSGLGLGFDVIAEGLGAGCLRTAAAGTCPFVAAMLP